MDLSGLVGAIRRGNLTSVQGYVAEIPSVNVLVEGLSLLYIATFKQRLNIVEFLLAKGADENLRNEEDQDTPVLLATRRSDVEMVRMLLTPKTKLLALSEDVSMLCELEAAISSPAVPVSALDAIPLRTSSTGRECSICFSDDTEMGRLERCGHACCIDCLKDYLVTSVEALFTASTTPIVRCFAKGCQESISVRDIESYASSASTERYMKKLCHAALRFMPDFAWCTKCENGGFFTSDTCTDSTSPCLSVECNSCTHQFCRLCRRDAHPNISCSEAFQAFILTDAFYTERLSSRLLQKICKPCPGPNCGVPTQRDGGCSHMTCRVCRYQWCWLCGGPYQGRYTFNNNCPCGN